MKNIYSKVVYISVLLVFVGHFHQGVMLHNFCNPLLVTPLIDNTYWLLFFFGIPQLILSTPPLSWTIDISLVALPIILLFRESRFFTILLFLFLTLYIICYAGSIAYQGHGLYGLLLILFPLMFQNKGRNRWIEISRFYTCFIFVSAGLWKVVRSHLFDVDHFSNILRSQHVSHFYYNPNDWRLDIVDFLISNPIISSLLLYAGVLLQLSFIIGFITKKYDLGLALFTTLFLAFNWLVMDISFFNMFVVVILFLHHYETKGALQKYLPRLYKGCAWHQLDL